MTRLFWTRIGQLALIGAMGFAARTVAQGPAVEPASAGSEEMKESGRAAGAKATRVVTEYQPVQSSPNRTRNFLADFLNDEKAIWTSPKDLRFEDTVWLFPMSGVTAGLFVTDADISRHLSHSSKTLSHYSTLSDAGVASLIGSAGGMWLLSHYSHNDHWRETGFLAGEAAAHSLLMTEALKYSLRRERPYQGDGSGLFFQSGGTSFPSEHSAAAWSVAAVVAHEYPGTLSKLLAYGVAGMVSYARFRAEKHFPSDVLVGALIGELSAYKIYSRHHDPELGGDNWESWSSQTKELFEHPTRANMGSPYVPLDSWMYPAIERLMGLGLIDSGFLGHRPWTRWECARLVSEAEDRVGDSEEAVEILTSLQRELQSEWAPPNGELNATLESVYARVTGISGRPLGPGGESFDFGQTIINDYGRPYAEGTNAVAGFSFYTTGGPWIGYVRGEFQYAPSSSPLTLTERTFMATVDGYGSTLGIPPATPIATTKQFKLVEAYTGLQFSNWLFSFGPQQLWGSPTEGGPMLVNDNSQAIPMFRIARTAPFKVPLLSKLLGPAWFEFFVGQLGGQYIFRSASQPIIGNYLEPLQNQPYIHGERISFKPTRNFEFGVTRTVVFGGGDIPMTLGYFGRSLINRGEHHTPKGTPNDPGKQASGLDWNYRLPLMRNRVSFYGDAFAWDQLSPIAYWDRSAISAGLYFSHIPKIPKLDFRVEGVYSDVPAGGAIGHGFYYSSGSSPYLQGYTNGGNLMGSWIGRDGQGAQAWTNYWFTHRNRLQFSFRHEKVSQQFLPGGATLTDVGTRADYWLGQRLGIGASVRYERWVYPVIQPGTQTNVATSVEIQFQPQRIWKTSPRQVFGSRVETGGAN